MPGFLVSPEDVVGGRLYLKGSEAHHLLRVRRYRTGDLVDVIDGCGSYYSARLESVEGETAVCSIIECCRGSGESAVEVELAPAVIKGQRFDFVIEKATELGVVGICPILTERGVVGPGSDNRRDRWNRLAVAAAKQCGRSLVPQVAAPTAFADVVASMVERNDLVLMASPGDSVGGLDERLHGGESRRLGLLVGPEGGFSSAETEIARKAGVELFSWGDRTLRADTASVVLTALLLHEAERERG